MGTHSGQMGYPPPAPGGRGGTMLIKAKNGMAAWYVTGHWSEVQRFGQWFVPVCGEPLGMQINVWQQHWICTFKLLVSWNASLPHQPRYVLKKALHRALGQDQLSEQWGGRACDPFGCAHRWCFGCCYFCLVCSGGAVFVLFGKYTIIPLL